MRILEELSAGCEAAMRSRFPVFGSFAELFVQANQHRGGHLSCWLLRDGSFAYAKGSNHDDSAAKVFNQAGLPEHADSALELMHLIGAERLRVHSNFVQVILATPPTLKQTNQIAAIAISLKAVGGTFFYEAVDIDGIQILVDGNSLSEFEAVDWNAVFLQENGVDDEKR